MSERYFAIAAACRWHPETTSQHDGTSAAAFSARSVKIRFRIEPSRAVLGVEETHPSRHAIIVGGRSSPPGCASKDSAAKGGIEVVANEQCQFSAMAELGRYCVVSHRASSEVLV